MRAGCGRAVSCHLCRLPPPLSAATVAVAKLTAPARTAPPLPELCRSGLPDHDAEAGHAFCAAASHLHPRHQRPFVLSRVAASAALAQARRGGDVGAPREGRSSALVFTGHRRDAAAQYRCQLSMSHEDAVAAAVASPLPSAPSTSSVIDETDHVSASACAAPSLAFAVDVVPVEEVHRVWRRFPQLGQRWMPQCATVATPDAAQRALAYMQVAQPLFTTAGDRGCDAPSAAAPPSCPTTSQRRGEWWTRFRAPCTSAAEAYGAVVLAQHWGARECAVKLVGVSDRAFAYGCLHAPPGSATSERALPTACLPFSTAFMMPDVVYQATVGGAEEETLRRHGLQPLLYLCAWTEWAPASETADAPHVVVLACAPRIASSAS